MNQNHKLVPLNSRVKHSSQAFLLDLTNAISEAGIPEGNYVDIWLDTDIHPPTFIIGDVGTEKPRTSVGTVRKVRQSGKISIPSQMILSGQGSGPSLNLEDYYSTHRLLFSPTAAKGILAIEPIEWEDGSIFTPSEEHNEESNRAASIGGEDDDVQPLSSQSIAHVAQMEGVDKNRLRSAVCSIEQAPSEPSHSEEYDILESDGMKIYLIEKTEWIKIARRAGIMAEKVVNAAQSVQRMIAEDIFYEMDLRDYDRAVNDSLCVVVKQAR